MYGALLYNGITTETLGVTYLPPALIVLLHDNLTKLSHIPYTDTHRVTTRLW